MGFVLSAFDLAETIDQIVVAVVPEQIRRAERIASEFATRKVALVVAGGSTRRDSVRRGLGGVDPSTEVVVVHDAARPFAPPQLIDECAHIAARAGAVTTGCRVSDTVKRAEGGVVLETPDRESLYFTQTPQAFERGLLQSAHDDERNRGVSVTDDATLLERLGRRVRIVDSPDTNIKITTAFDIELAGRMIDAGRVWVSDVVTEKMRVAGGGSGSWSSEIRVGFGFDSHRFSSERKLILGGVEIEHDKGLRGHSDGDALCHSLCDAILGAASLGDIGILFPDTDPRYEGANSLDLLRQVAQLAAESGWDVSNLDATVIAQQPRLAEYHNMMRETISRAVGVDPSCVSVKAKTAEGMDALGRGEGIAVHSVAVVSKRRS